MGFKCTYIVTNISYFLSLVFCVLSMFRSDWYVLKDKRYIAALKDGAPISFGLMEVPCNNPEHPCPKSKLSYKKMGILSKSTRV